MNEITVQQLKQMQDAKEAFQLIDVREQWEVEVCSIGAEHIALGEIIERRNELKTDIPVIVHCRSGARSANAINALQMQFGTDNLHNLVGGILAWADEIDTSLEKY